MTYIEKLKYQGFKNLFVISTASTFALLALIFASIITALFAFVISFFVSLIIYKNYGNLIDSFFFEQRITNKSANELAVAYLFAQGLVVGTIFGWTFGRAYFG